MACEGHPITVAKEWAPWDVTGVVVVDDPKYGPISLEYQGLPLHSWKSGALPDGSSWMWLGWGFVRGNASGLIGLLFFARTWERWKALQFVSYRPDVYLSTWAGTDGTGRVKGLEVEVTAAPYLPDWL